MNCTKVLLFIIISCSITHAQSYFQQDVDYIITADLDDAAHTLTGDMSITYTNNAPESLNEMYIHLWANAFKDNSTYFAQDQIKRGRRDFYFAPEEDRGSYSSLTITMDGKEISYERVDDYDDVIKITLPTSLASGQSISINIDFTLKIPAMFSRLGRRDSTYHFTHWYPRMAVYDRNGWNPMHYGFGEFYGEFANYQVSLTLPSDYRIAFTGRGVAGLPAKEGDKMSWVLNAENVHDFAWVASLDYQTDYEKVKSIDGREISLTVLYRDNYRPYWSEALGYLKESLDYYEREVGPYAYDQIVLVQDVEGGDLNMEYPGLIIVGDRGTEKSLEYYINHELGHQWFYGALGFNEYAEPWLDEGLTTFYEHRYTLNKYGISHYGAMSDNFIKSRNGLEPMHAIIHANNRCRCHQRADTPISDMTTVNYGIRSYEMAATYYKYLERYLGREVFDKAMQSFYAEWKFKHPSTADLQMHLEQFSEKDLSWFFKDLLLTDGDVDFTLNHIDEDNDATQVVLLNQSDYSLPVYISFKNGDTTVGGKWMEPFAGNIGVEVPEGVSDIVLDEENLLFDINRSDNQIKTYGAFKKKKPIAFSTANSTDPSDENNVFAALLGGFNTTDGLFLGPVILNSTIPPHGFRWEVMPYYAFESKSLVGHARMAYDHYFKTGAVRGMEYSLGAKSFHFSDFESPQFPDFESNLRYSRIEYRVNMIFRHKPISGISSGLEFRNLSIFRDRLNFDIDDVPPGKDLIRDDIQLITYSRKRRNALTTNKLRVELEHQSYEDILDENITKRYLKLTTVLDKKVYFSKDKFFNIRFFGAGFLHNTERDISNYNTSLVHGSIPLLAGGHNDYMYDGKFFNRRDQDESRFVLNQIGVHGGGFKNAIGAAYNLGYSNNFALSINMSSHIPLRLPRFLKPLKVFLDTGYYSAKSFSAEPAKNQFLFSSGLMLDMRVLKIHLPLVQSKLINDIYNSEDLGIFQRITFSLDFPRFDYNETVEFIAN